jgi:hypothetical protein
MLLTCPLYSNLRKVYGFEFKDTSTERFVYVLASVNTFVLSRLAAFVFYAVEVRTNTRSASCCLPYSYTKLTVEQSTLGQLAAVFHTVTPS